MNHIEQVFVNLNFVKVLKMAMVEVMHKSRTTSRMINKTMPILQELNPRVTDWRAVPPLLDIWIYYRAQIKDIILEFGIEYLSRYPRLPLGSKSPIFGDMAVRVLNSSVN
jgi:hypothetical protein